MTEIFLRVDLGDEAPSCICDKCSQLAMRHEPTESVFAYCRHREIGAMLTPGSDWYLVENVSAENFKQAVLLAVLEGEQRFIDAQTSGMSRN